MDKDEFIDELTKLAEEVFDILKGRVDTDSEGIQFAKDFIEMIDCSEDQAIKRRYKIKLAAAAMEQLGNEL
ncbi:hypothetical protein GUM07_03940 [Listeria monocytogenes]|nr:hypothetical protein [Listeria monocytogenes]